MLELGKYYQQRNGVIVGPLEAYTGRMNKDGFTFCCSAEGISDRAWREDGSFSLYKDDKSAFDIVYGVEWVPLKQQTPKEEIMSKEFKIEVGKYYKDRRGHTFGPVQRLYDNGAYCFSDSEGSSYTEDGYYVKDEESEYDLIKEVPDPYEIKPEEIVKIADADNRPTIEEVLSAIQRGDEVTAEDDDGDFYNIYSNNPISLLLDAKSFTLKAKQPVVKYKYVFQVQGSDDIVVGRDYFESDNDFLGEDRAEDYKFFKPIQATRKEF